MGAAISGSKQIAPEAISDIAKLAQGVSRVEVALAALRETPLTPSQVAQLEALSKAAARSEGSPSATPSLAAGRYKQLGELWGVVGHIRTENDFGHPVNYDTLIAEKTFGPMTKDDQRSYGSQLGYSIGGHREHLLYVNSLLEKRANGSINEAESDVLRTYEDRQVRDTHYRVYIRDGKIRTERDDPWIQVPKPGTGAFLIRESDNSRLEPK